MKEKMPNIRVMSSSTVKPTSGDHHHLHRLELTPCDLQHLLFTLQRGLIYHKPTSHFALVDRLKATLSQALDIFYPLAGRLDAVESDPDGDGTASFSVDCCGAGALFVHAVSEDVAVADVLGQPIGCLFPMTEVAGYRTVTDPFLAVQVTELVDGIFVAVSMGHVIADGTSFWHFINTWAHISGGRDLSRRYLPPSFNRGCFQDLFNLPLRIPFSYRNIPSQTWKPDSPTVQTRIFHFSRQTIARLKAEANAEALSAQVGPAISSLQALMAHLWVCVTRCRGLAGDEEVTHMFALGLRGRMQPPLASEYFGNAVRNTAATSTARELLGPSGFGLAARWISEAAAAQTPAELRRFLEEWVLRPVYVGSETLPRNLLYTGGSPRFDALGNDFGWGPQVAVQRNRFLLDGNLTPSAGAEEGSVDLEVTLLGDSLQALGEDPEFRGNKPL